MKKIIFILLIIILCIPKIEDDMKLFSLKSLDGVTVPAEKPKFDFEQWWNGNFQTNFGEYIDETFGLRNFFIRLYNQFDFSLFKKAHGSVVIGKDNFLFQNEYINEYNGSNFIGEDAMKYNIENIRKTEAFLNSKNIFLATILAPSKADYYKDYLPGYYLKNISLQRNYTALLKYGKLQNIRLVDFNNWFLQLKDTSRYPLFPKQGIHWNFYGMALSADSIVKYIESQRKIALPQISWTLELPDTLRETDYDLGGLLNIFETLPYDKMPYPHFTFSSDSSASKPRLLVIGDSFYWGIYNERVLSRVFNDETFYYYNSTISPADRALSRNPYDLNILKEVEKYDIVLLLQSSGNYGNPGLGFVQLFTREMDRREEYKLKAKSITDADSNLLIRSKQIALENNISIDSSKSIIIDSLVDKRFDEISSCKIQMRNNPGWMKQIFEKSKLWDKSVEEVMQSDAEWMIDQHGK